MEFRTKKRLIILFLFLLFIPNVFVSASTNPSRGGDFRGFLNAGNRFIAGNFLYEGSSVATNVTWPPFFAVFIAPFSLLARFSLPLTQVVWYIINAFIFLLTIDIWCRLFYKKPLGWFDEKNDLSFYSMAVFMPVAFTAQSVFKVFVPLQINILLLFLMSLAFLNIREGKAIAGGFWLGIAVCIKVFPVLTAPYFLFRRKYKMLISLTLTVIVLTLLPVIRYGWEGYLMNLKAWIDISLSGGYPIGGLNQSVYAMIGRWIAANPFELIMHKLPTPPVDSPGSIATLWTYRSLYVVVLAGFLLLLWKNNINFPEIEAAFLILMSFIFSPIAWRNYWILSFPGYFVLYNIYLKSKNKILLYCLWISFFLVTVLSVVGQFGKPIRGFSLSVTSNLTLGIIVLIFGIIFSIIKISKVNNMQTTQPEKL